jgi:hypothetical protein
MPPGFQRRELAIVLLDGALGVAIGAISVGSRTAAAPLVTHRLAGFLSGAGFSLLALGVPMLLATLTLAPVLLMFLRTQAALPRRAYYTRSAAAGFLFGIAASAGVGFYTGVILPFLPRLDASLAQRLVLAVGAPGLLTMGFGLSSMLFLPQILVTGIGFGLLNGWLVRRGGAPSPRA